MAQFTSFAQLGLFQDALHDRLETPVQRASFKQLLISSPYTYTSSLAEMVQLTVFPTVAGSANRGWPVWFTNCPSIYRTAQSPIRPWVTRRNIRRMSTRTLQILRAKSSMGVLPRPAQASAELVLNSALDRRAVDPYPIQYETTPESLEIERRDP